MHKVLLIEDDTVVRENTAEILELAGYEVTTAPNGKVGVTTAISSLPDIIVCDIMMPELDGYGVLQQLGAEELTKHIPFIFLSAKTEHKDIRKGMDMGADDYLTKPFEENELISAIESRVAKAAILREERNKQGGGDDDDAFLRSLNDLKNYVDDNGKTLKLKKGETVFEQGHHSNYIYLITKGIIKCHKIDVSGKELTTALYREDDLFGYATLLQNIAHQESATAMESTEIIAVPKEELNEVLHKNHKVNFDLINLLSDNLEETKKQLLQMAYGSVRKKTATTILQFAEKMNKKPDEALKISRNDLASVAGIATESLIRTLSAFSKEGLIDIEGRNIKILDIKALAQVD